MCVNVIILTSEKLLTFHFQVGEKNSFGCFFCVNLFWESNDECYSLLNLQQQGTSSIFSPL